MTVDQPTANPTNKLTAAMVAGALVAIVRATVSHFAPEFDDEAIWVAITPLAILAAGYFIRDKANV